MIKKKLVSSIKKHSLVLNGKKTSVSLEDVFWEALIKLAVDSKKTVTDIVEDIDKKRDHANLSSAVRVHLFNFLRT